MRFSSLLPINILAHFPMVAFSVVDCFVTSVGEWSTSKNQYFFTPPGAERLVTCVVIIGSFSHVHTFDWVCKCLVQVFHWLLKLHVRLFDWISKTVTCTGVRKLSKETRTTGHLAGSDTDRPIKRQTGLSVRVASWI